ncbi:MAG: type II toxin-antitoxin system RelE/ParE family toxin [Alphaproteobacteria bacterium]|nr:type II toxin-antitoxin system RelE/ParE family toxin [Alphaproteobacteria bacterium]
MTISTKWSIHFNKIAQKNFEKLDKQTQKKIQKFLRERLLQAENPRLLGKPLSGNLSDFWRYRIEDYRVICKIEDKELIILVVRIAHRSRVYD